ncbi:hypothetical protein KJ909_03950 [Patescibacteria group bacterium]|nr:hypothetical protein [Patescibacteria group bacterium]
MKTQEEQIREVGARALRRVFTILGGLVVLSFGLIWLLYQVFGGSPMVLFAPVVEILACFPIYWWCQRQIQKDLLAVPRVPQGYENLVDNLMNDHRLEDEYRVVDGRCYINGRYCGRVEAIKKINLYPVDEDPPKEE